MTLPAHGRYRRSRQEWLPEIPAHWTTMRLANLFTERSEPGVCELPILSVSIHDGVSDDEMDQEELDRKVTRSDDRSKYKRVFPGDLVYNMMRAWQGGFGTVAVHGMVSPAYVVAQPRSRCETRYFEHVLRTPMAIEEMRRRSRGVTDFRLRLYWDEFKNLRVPVPPGDEQSAIVEFIRDQSERFDALINEQRRLIDLLNEKLRAVISHAVTKGLNPDVPMKPSGVEWLGDIPAHWEVVGLTKYLESVVDYRGRTPTKVDEGVLLLTARNIRNGRIDYDASAEFIPDAEYESVMSRGKPAIGDVLFTTEAPLGQVANVDRADVALAQRIIKFRGRPGALNNEYLKYWLLGDFAQADMQRLATGSTALGIKGSKVGQLRLAVPPIAEQGQIVSFIERAADELELLRKDSQRAIGILQERRTALICASVTGQIDVRGHAVAGVA